MLLWKGGQTRAHLATSGLRKSRDMANRKGLDFELDTSTGLGQMVIEVGSYRLQPLPGDDGGRPDQER